VNRIFNASTSRLTGACKLGYVAAAGQGEAVAGLPVPGWCWPRSHRATGRQRPVSRAQRRC
jgi:hypothetical protein